MIPRSSIGNPQLITSMQKRAEELGKTLAVTDLAIYETVEKQNDLIPVLHLVEEDAIDGVCFTSASTVRAFVYANPDIDPVKIHALCIGEMTAQAAREAGMQVNVAKEASVEGLVELVEKLYVKS